MRAADEAAGRMAAHRRRAERGSSGAPAAASKKSSTAPNTVWSWYGWRSSAPGGDCAGHTHSTQGLRLPRPAAAAVDGGGACVPRNNAATARRARARAAAAASSSPSDHGVATTAPTSQYTSMTVAVAVAVAGEVGGTSATAAGAAAGGSTSRACSKLVPTSRRASGTACTIAPPSITLLGLPSVHGTMTIPIRATGTRMNAGVVAVPLVCPLPPVVLV